MAYLFLSAAICCEIVATLSLRAADGVSRPAFLGLVFAGYLGALVGLSFALRHGMSISVAYALWSAVGVATVAILSVPLFGETLSAVQAGGVVLIIVGVLVLELGTAH